MNGKVKCELLNVRMTPEKADNIVAVVTKGTELLVVEGVNGWLRINSGDVDGYVMAEFVAIEVEPELVVGQAVAAEVDENGNFSVDGKVIGHVEGDDIVITDPEVIQETLKDAPVAQEEAAGQTDAETPEKPKKSRKKGGEEDEQTGAAE